MIGIIKGTMRQAKEVSGLPLPIASYKANMKGNLKSLNVAITAKQSGSGDPYPAGGGANKWDEEWESGDLNVSSDGGNHTNANRIRSKNYIPVTPETSYYLTSSYPNTIVAFYDSSKAYPYNTQNVGWISLPANKIVAVPDWCYYIRFYYNATTYSHDVALNYPSSVTTYSPYSNIRPISGVSECNVVDMSDNTNINYFQGLLNGTYGFVNLGDLTWTSETTQVEGEYRLRSTGISSIVKRVAANNLVANIICPNYDATSSNAIYQSNTKGIAINTSGYIFVYDEDYSTSTSYTDFKTAMNGVYLIYELATATTPTITAEQFNSLLSAFGISGCCLNIVLGDTYYGCSLNVTTGVLTVDTARILFNTSSTFYQSGYAAYKELDGAFISDSYGYGMCDSYNFGTWTETTADGVNSRFTIYKHTSWSKPRLAFSLNGKTLNQFMNSLSSEPIDLIYKLETPITVQLTPTPTQVEQLLGTNNVWADTGDVEELKYFDRQVYYGR